VDGPGSPVARRGPGGQYRDRASSPPTTSHCLAAVHRPSDHGHTFHHEWRVWSGRRGHGHALGRPALDPL